MEQDASDTLAAPSVQLPDRAAVGPSEVALIVGAGPWVAEVEARAAAVGAPVDRYDATARGLAGLAGWVGAHGPGVLYLPARVGRWLPAPTGPAGGSVRAIALVGDEPGAAGTDAVRAAFGPNPEIVSWPIHGRPGPPDVGAAGGADWRVPADEVERQVLDLVERVTGGAGIGVDESFFDVGGTADAAAWLADEVSWRFDLGLRPVELFDHPTVAELAELVRREGGRSVRRPVTATLAGDPDGAEVVFLVHDLGGSAFPLAPIAADLAGSLGIRVVGIESPLLNGAPNPFRTLELMAMRYLVDIRRVQPAGPYRLAGWGFGGAVAFEMARQLADEGAEVGLLAVGDVGPGIVHRGGPRRVPRWMGDLSRRRGSRAPVALPDRPARARAEHARLLASQRWPSRRLPSVPVALAWSADVGARDATMGWAGIVDLDLLTIDRLPTEHGDPASADVVESWTPVLRRRLGGT